ncbi:hypothetical protein EOW26_26810, partial [Salmonella enterica]|nr:hypothetical protein [Salmonella enterica]EBH9194342.1 hypothetical protein [Salmonella enterica subsp. enterica serovar 4,[5],12:i:-]EBH9245669.1 hypothetical protein [Salmonella enterica subsp. enterica serovar 4,[5],12:i:-]
KSCPPSAAAAAFGLAAARSLRALAQGRFAPWTPDVRHVAGVRGYGPAALHSHTPAGSVRGFHRRQGQAATRSLREP